MKIMQLTMAVTSFILPSFSSIDEIELIHFQDNQCIVGKTIDDLLAALQISNTEPSLMALVIQDLPRPNLDGCLECYSKKLSLHRDLTVLYGEVFL